MKDSKLVLTLCSVLALAACGGGSGGGGAPATSGGSSISAPVTPTNTISTTDYRTVENPNVNSNNTSVTNMGSYSVTNAAAVHTAMVDYVSDRLGGDIYTTDNYNALNLGRGASIRSSAKVGLTDEQKFAIADAKINQMKNIIADLTNAATDEARLEYVTTNRAAVADALMLFTNGVNAETLVEDLITTFDGLNITNLQTAFDNFDSTNSFVYNKEMLNEVDFVVTGGDETILRFGMDENGNITGIAPGHKDGNDIWGADSEIGWLTRAPNNSAQFSTTVNDYSLDITDAFNALVADDIITSLASTDGLEKIKTLSIRTATALADADAVKTALLAEFDRRVQKFLGDQNNGSTEADELAALRAYITDNANAAIWEDVSHATPTLTASLTGVGKDLATKLKYADFGYLDINDDGDRQFLPYIGGYNTSHKVNMENVNPETDVTYTGTAIAGLNARGAEGRILRQENAQLVYQHDTGKSVLTMDNLKYDDNGQQKDWYTMVVTGKPNSDLRFDFAKDGKTVDAAYQFYDESKPATWYQVFAGAGAPDGVRMDDGGEFSYSTGTGETLNRRGYAEANYYSASQNEVATEATAGFSFSETHSADGHTDHEVKIYGAFGGTKQ